MEEKIKITTSHSDYLLGSTVYNITLEIINLTGKDLYELNVKAITIPGRLLSLQGEPSYGERYKEDIVYEEILYELNLQIVEAYKLNQRIKSKNVKALQKLRDQKKKDIQNRKIEDQGIDDPRKRSKQELHVEEALQTESVTSQNTRDNKQVNSDVSNELELILDEIQSDEKPSNSLNGYSKSSDLVQKAIKILIPIVPSLLSFALDFYTPISSSASLSSENDSSKELESLIPKYMRQAIKIRDWNDLERLENIFILPLPESVFLRKAFEINKLKLYEILEQRKVIGQGDVNRLAVFKPNQIISFIFCCRSPMLFSQKKLDAEFEVSFIERESLSGEDVNEILGRKVFRKTLIFWSSEHSVSFGTVVGSIFGFFVKEIFFNSSNLASLTFWYNSISELFGAILLGFILAVATRRTGESRSFLTVEDFSGGFFVGSLAGLFSEQILDFLRTLLPGTEPQA